ncbi:MarR family winged helix-turn-helix transcriptional regulator [Streptomyces sp. NL15-2K]|uniref:MarR family winged helix-turn-helix transcriptional regulator n=1 Tax=Streptomyces sp. NL15-2K TaxID=376149 RepID=UPI000F57CFCB|nr:MULTISPECIES: MarR family transcriptional regulator [Actinomycetes]WKX15782.1 MarR family transcriptional regulator [Kutzneria buriramensis]GCB42880.1 transcriptional regulator [Streptomyces sp. NL15-2K]
MGAHEEISTAKEAADHELVLAFGRLQGAANRLEYILGRKIEEECGISHLMYEVLLILARTGGPGLSMRTISREQVLTTGGVTRLVDRMETAGLVERATDPGDRRGRLVRLTPLGEETAVHASRLHVENIKRYFLEPLPASHRERFAEDLRILSHSAGGSLPLLP